MLSNERPIWCCWVKTHCRAQGLFPEFLRVYWKPVVPLYSDHGGGGHLQREILGGGKWYELSERQRGCHRMAASKHRLPPWLGGSGGDSVVLTCQRRGFDLWSGHPVNAWIRGTMSRCSLSTLGNPWSQRAAQWERQFRGRRPPSPFLSEQLLLLLVLRTPYSRWKGAGNLTKWHILHVILLSVIINPSVEILKMQFKMEP